MSEPVRVAQVMGKMVNGGVDAVIMNYYRHIDRNKIQFDFIIDSDSKYVPKEEIEKLGGRIFVVPPYQKLHKYIPALIKLFKENKYLIVHSNINTLSVFPLFAAWIARVPNRIAHNHATAAKGEFKRNIMKYSLRPFSKVFATHYVACSKYAGEWLFGKKAMRDGKVTIFNNAIDIDKFKFDPVIRKEVRQELGVEGKFVIGHVGRFCYAKNHEFLIDIFEKVLKKRPDAVLMLVGDGPDREKIEEKVKKLDGGVILLGNRNDAYRLYQAMDVFVLPSRIEGFPVVGVEAQVNGLTVLFSDQVPKEAQLTDNVRFIPLKSDTEYWAYAIIESNTCRKKADIGLYDITVQADSLTRFYEECLNYSE